MFSIELDGKRHAARTHLEALELLTGAGYARGIMDSIRVILGGSRNTPKINQAIVDIDNYIADMYNTQ